MDKIKSFYINKKIFFLLYEKRKLSLFKYNKNLQNKFNINLINYKLFSDRIVIGGEDGISKEYNNNKQLIYEGEYSKGKRNGKGKEYSGETIIFEGEYLNGKRWNEKGYFNQKIYEIKDGKGTMKEYIKNSNLIFQGLYSNGLKNGKGKEYTICDKSIEIKFDGEYMYGTKWNGKLVLNNKIYELKNGMFITKFDDENNIKENYLYGEKNGKCEEYNEEGKLIFVGEFLMGKRHGKGREYYDEGRLKFEGEYINGIRHGKGKEYNYKGELIYEGEYLFNYKIKGKQYINEKLEYEGDYLNGKKWNGKGYDEKGNIIYELKNGTGKIREYDIFSNLHYEGIYLNLCGDGKEFNKDYKIFEGEYCNGKRNGKGKEFNKMGYMIFEGEYRDNKRNGKGKEYKKKSVKKLEPEYFIRKLYRKYKEFNNDNILIFEGEYLNGSRNGKGKEYNENGKLIFEGEYSNGEKMVKEKNIMKKVN